MKILINYQSKSYILDQLPEEDISETYMRLWKIIQHNPTNDIAFDKLVNISKCWYYHQHLNCKYSPNVQKVIDLFFIIS